MCASTPLPPERECAAVASARARALTRRDILRAGLAAGAGVSLLPGWARGRGMEPDLAAHASAEPPAARADACIWIWLPGGVAQTDTWDPKQHTPYRQGMKGSEVLGTCESIPTAADGVRIGAGLEQIATVMDRGCILRSLANDIMFGAVHLRAQYYAMTGYVHPAGFKAPSIGSLVGRALGRRDPLVPEYIYIGRDIGLADSENLFIAEYLGPGFLGTPAAPFMIPDPTAGLATLSLPAGMSRERHERRQAMLAALAAAAPAGLGEAEAAARYRKMIADARAMMDSPVKQVFEYMKEETPETIAAYEPRIEADALLDKSYYFGRRFGHGLLMARRLVERGARFVQVEYQYGPFKGFDMHESGATRMAEMKRQIDGPIAQLIRDLDQRGMLERTLVVLATEFGRTIASKPAAGTEPEGSSESHTGEDLVIENEKMYGFHGHFSSCNTMVFFGGGFKRGIAHGRTADRHPMIAIEKPVKLMDAHATIYTAMGIAPDHANVVEGRPVYVTKDGKGQSVSALLA